MGWPHHHPDGKRVVLDRQTTRTSQVLGLVVLVLWTVPAGLAALAVLAVVASRWYATRLGVR